MTQLRITIDIFSGRPNPIVHLDDNEAERLLPGLRPAEPVAADDPVRPPSLGYRGLLIEQTDVPDPALPRVFRIAFGRLYGPGLRHWATNREVERTLFAPGGPLGLAVGDGDVLDVIRTGIDVPPRPVTRPPTAEGTAPEPCGSAPEADLAWWNDADPEATLCLGGSGAWRRQCNNNCYNYATNVRTDTFAQPGRGSGRSLERFDCATLRLAAFYDNLMDAPYADNMCVERSTLVAGVIWPGRDFHWYRKNEDGHWTHKPGLRPATDLDDSGWKIEDPRYCNRGVYKVFCSFMVVKDGHPRVM